MGTAAWILEGTTSLVQISGRVITPGQDSDISAYRSELSGILAAITVINALMKSHNIVTKVMLRCDCEKGVEKAFDTVLPTLVDKSNDLLKAIHHKVRNCNIQWSGTHIRGHQDDTVPFNELDRPSQLNVIVDRMAKEFSSSIDITKRHSDVYSPSWTIKLGNIPLIHNIDNTIYDIVHIPHAKKYWTLKSKIQEESFDHVQWSRVGQALDKMSLRKRLFCSKHTSGMCSVGKFQKIWRLRVTNTCPHCDQYEDFSHVWKCQHVTVTDVWRSSLSKLKRELQKLDTDPALLQCILSYLNSWRSNQPLISLNNEDLQRLLDNQNKIGAEQFFEGWHHTDWELWQNIYYNDTKSRRSGKRWSIAVITKLWDITWDLWEFRNAVYHHQHSRVLQEDTSALDIQVRGLHNNLSLTGLLSKDQHLTKISIHRLLLFPRKQKVELIRQATLAMTEAKKRHFRFRQSTHEQLRRHQLMFSSMQLYMRNWLNQFLSMTFMRFPRAPGRSVVTLDLQLL
jgi:hypothetical protein